MSVNAPSELKYTKEHEWTKIEGDIVAVGITDFAQNSLGDIVYVELPEIGSTLTHGNAFGVVESIKSVSDLYAPISGEVVEVNTKLEKNPELINGNAYESWIVKIKINNKGELNNLLSSADYIDFCENS